VKCGVNIERWRYGDPVYNLDDSSRYADFTGDELAGFSEGLVPVSPKTAAVGPEREVNPPRTSDLIEP
jgi:hypothetical protein